MSRWTYKELIIERMKRQGWSQPLEDERDEEAYTELFRRLQPVAPVHFTRPGDPPKLVHRTEFDDTELSSSLRERHVLVKGRFQGGRIGYVHKDDLQLYATAFRKLPAVFNRVHEDVLNAVRESGGLTKAQLKEELDYSSGDIGKALQDLQCAFLLQEDQIDTDWETGWLDFAEEWFELPDHEEHQVQALKEVILRFVESMVFATEGQIKSWSSVPLKKIKEYVISLIEEGKLVRAEIDGIGAGVMLSKDALSGPAAGEQLSPSIYMLDKSDFMVRAYMDELKSRYKGLEVLQYLLIDGEFRGAVLGHWRIGPYDVDDIIVELDETEAVVRQEEVLKEVRKIYSPDSCNIWRYNGTYIQLEKDGE